MNETEAIESEISSQYERAKQLAKEIWLGENETEDADSSYYFKCGFIAGIAYENNRNK